MEGNWYTRHNLRQPNPHNEFNHISDHITQNWPAPNYVNPQSRIAFVHSYEIATTVLGALAVALRLLARYKTGKRLMWEDYTIMASLLFASLRTAMVTISTNYGFGLRRWDIPMENYNKLNKYVISGICTYLCGINLTKASIVLRYIRMFPPEVGLIRKICVFLVPCFALLFIAVLIVVANICRPLRSLWDVYIPGYSINIKVLFFAHCSGNALIDFLVYGIPIPYMVKLNLPIRQRIGLVLVFALGFVVCSMTLCELPYVAKTFEPGYFDYTWNGPRLWFFTAMEADLAIVAASLPDLKPLLAMLWDGLSVRLSLRSKSDMESNNSSHGLPGLRDEPGHDERRRVVKPDWYMTSSLRRDSEPMPIVPHHHTPEVTIFPDDIIEEKSSSLVDVNLAHTGKS